MEPNSYSSIKLKTIAKQTPGKMTVAKDNKAKIVDCKKQSINSINENSRVWFESIEDPLA